MKIEHIRTFNWEASIRGMRNPLKSWEKSDSVFNGDFIHIGKNDYDLCKRLIKAGNEHRKFVRQICVSMDITAPEYFWKEWATYKIGTIENSTSTMHTLMKRNLTIDDFEWDSNNDSRNLKDIIRMINNLRLVYIETKNKDYQKLIWREIIQLLPMSYLYTRTVSLNYENLISMYKQRKTHKLIEWRNLFFDVLGTIPYPEFITGDFK